MPTPAEIQALFDHWHDFFLLAGTAAVTLLGLLFVALSLHLDLLVCNEGAYLKAIALEAFFSFIMFEQWKIHNPKEIPSVLWDEVQSMSHFQPKRPQNRKRLIPGA